MASFFYLLGLLLALVASGYSLSCIHCISPLYTSCSGPSISCPSNHQCGASLTQTSSSGIVLNMYARSCVPQNSCAIKGSVTIPNGKIKMVTACCGNNDCTPELPSLPGSGSNPNGLTCRSCASENSNWCYTSDTMECTGDENMCLLQTTKISGSRSLSTAVRGCSTKSICDLGSQSFSGQGMSSDIKFICTSGSVGLQKGFYLPALMSLFLLKLFI